MKQLIYIVIAIAVFIFAFCVCFRAWADKEIFVHRICAHRYMGRAILVEAQYGGGCEWQPLDKPKLDNTWGNCTGLIEGQTYDYPEASYACE